MKIVIAIIAAVIAAAGIGGFVMMNNETPQPSSTQNTSSGDTMDGMDMGPGQADPADENSEAVQTSSVEISNFAFKPAKITIKKGTTVTWTNKDSAMHDVTPTGGGADFKASELLAKGESYSFTFNTTGTYTYLCSPHPYMKGTVEVTE